MASLMLYPTQSDWADQNQALKSCLHACGMIGNPVPPKFGDGFLVGDAFISLINFMGCAPSISFSPEKADTTDDFCVIRIHQYPSPQFLSAARLPVPRCPLCRTRFKEAVAVNDPKTEIDCKTCGQYQPLYSLIWRHAAGFASSFIEVTSVYPQEALPVESLMNTLSAISQCEWAYFYR